MAINFEAANMAGYNNPKIEVFKVTLNDEFGIADAPNQSVLSECINRGSVPFLHVTTAAHDSVYILPMNYIQQQTRGLDLGFSAVVRTGSAPSAPSFIFTIFYPSMGAPLMFTQEIPSGTT